MQVAGCIPPFEQVHEPSSMVLTDAKDKSHTVGKGVEEVRIDLVCHILQACGMVGGHVPTRPAPAIWLKFFDRSLART